MKKVLSSSMAALGALLAFISGGQAANFNVAVVAGLRFSPTNITVSVGDTVTWTGLSSFHTVTPAAGVSEPFCGEIRQASCVSTFLTAGSFAYRCIPHGGLGMTGSVTVVAAPQPPVTVAITNPLNNALFAAPATVPVGVSASSSTGIIVNIRLFTNDVLAASNGLFNSNFTLTNLAAGHYTLRARATDDINSGGSTSAPVTIRVVDRPILSFAPGTNGPLRLQFNTVTGVNYVVESTALLLTNTSTFSRRATNPGTGAGLLFAETNGGPAQNFYRVRVQ
jgi:plastocyanin